MTPDLRVPVVGKGGKCKPFTAGSKRYTFLQIEIVASW